jgi:Uncharacterised protein domain (DUF2415)
MQVAPAARTNLRRFDVCAGMQRVATQQVAHAVRTVKFSAEPVDLMAFAEHDNTFHVVDARKFNTRQSVRTSDTSIGISGVTFAPKVCTSWQLSRLHEWLYLSWAYNTRLSWRWHCLMLLQGSKLYVGLDGKGIQEWNVDTAARLGCSTSLMAWLHLKHGWSLSLPASWTARTQLPM